MSSLPIDYMEIDKFRDLKIQLESDKFDEFVTVPKIFIIELLTIIIDGKVIQYSESDMTV